MKPFLWGAVAGYVLYLFVPHHKIVKATQGRNLMGNAGGFAGGNPGRPAGPGFWFS